MPEACVHRVTDAGRRGYVFRTRDRAAAVVWSVTDATNRLALTLSIRAYDIMGNELSDRTIQFGDSPIYLVSARAGEIVKVLTRRNP